MEMRYVNANRHSDATGEAKEPFLCPQWDCLFVRGLSLSLLQEGVYEGSPEIGNFV